MSPSIRNFMISSGSAVIGAFTKFGYSRTEGRLIRASLNHSPTSVRPMAIIIDPSITKPQGPSRSSTPPLQPPPSYAESAATQPTVVQLGTSSTVLNAHAGYGPTPISRQQQAAIPYYDPRSVHSMRAAGRRAKERFVGAVLWAILILALLPMFVWVEVKIQ